jgi:hypothetical protein
MLHVIDAFPCRSPISDDTILASNFAHPLVVRSKRRNYESQANYRPHWCVTWSIFEWACWEYWRRACTQARQPSVDNQGRLGPITLLALNDIVILTIPPTMRHTWTYETLL